MTREKALALRALIEKAASAGLDDGDALEAVELFPVWAVGMEYAEGKRLRYGDELYRVKQAHTSQADWTPDIAISLYEKIAKPGQGDTPDNPIPYTGNMALVLNKYYSQNGVTYRCIRDSINPVYADLVDLVGLYVEVYNA